MRDLPADAIGPQRHATLHLVDRANPVGRVMIRVRDTCNTDPAAFEEYKVRHCDSDPTFIPKKYSPSPFTIQPAKSISIILFNELEGIGKNYVGFFLGGGRTGTKCYFHIILLLVALSPSVRLVIAFYVFGGTCLWN